jgi:hypothetical protein
MMRDLVRQFLIGWIVMLGTVGAAHAEWRYCLAPAEAARKVYLSGPFRTDAAMGAIETAFDQALTQAGIAHNRTQCPRADSESAIDAMRSHAISFNREFFGRAAVEISWTPTTSLTVRRVAPQRTE